MGSQRALPKITEVFPYWQDINSTDRLAMARQVQYHALPRGKIFCINDAITVSSLYVISGEVRYYTISADGRDTMLYRLHRGQYTSFLETKLYTNPNYSLTMQAEQPSEVYAISPIMSKYLCEHYPSALKFEREVFYDRSAFVMASLQRMLSVSSEQRLAMFLLEEIKRNGSRTLTLTQEQMGRYVGTHRKMISRMMNVFARHGIVRLSRGQVEVLKPEALKELAR